MPCCETAMLAGRWFPAVCAPIVASRSRGHVESVVSVLRVEAGVSMRDAFRGTQPSHVDVLEVMFLEYGPSSAFLHAIPRG